jgi:hypothetical protein
MAQRTWWQMSLLQLCCVAGQLLGQTKLIARDPTATCPALAAAVAAATAPVGTAALRVQLLRAAARCMAGRYWWVAVEAGVLAALAQRRSREHHRAMCTVMGLLRSTFQVELRVTQCKK